MSDPMDERLREAAHRWQLRQPAPPGLPESLEDHPPRSRRWLPASVAVATLVGAVVLTTTLLTRGAPERGPVATPGPTLSTGPTAALPAVPWADLPATHPKHTGKYGGVAAEGDLYLDAKAGETLTFTVYLTAAEATPLDPCPDYSIWVGRAGGPRRSLNCAAVPYVDARGVPYLPAFEPVAFEMRLKVPDLRGEQKILWVIEGPHQMTGTHGVLTIHR